MFVFKYEYIETLQSKKRTLLLVNTKMSAIYCRKNQIIQ